MLTKVDDWFKLGFIDIVLVVGTSLSVGACPEFLNDAMDKGARVAVVNSDVGDVPVELQELDWLFHGDAAILLPELFSNEIGSLS